MDLQRCEDSTARRTESNSPIFFDPYANDELRAVICSEELDRILALPRFEREREFVRSVLERRARLLN